MPWSLLGILLAVCAVACAVGFYKFVYFLSIGYGFAVAGGGIAILIMYIIRILELLKNLFIRLLLTMLLIFLLEIMQILYYMQYYYLRKKHLIIT